MRSLPSRPRTTLPEPTIRTAPTPQAAVVRVHGTCIAIDGGGVLLRGPSGCGKSDLALRLLDEGAELVADDQVLITVTEAGAFAAAPDAIAGLIEVRGLGIVRRPARARARLVLVADLVARPERMAARAHCRLGAVRLPLIQLAALEASAPAKIRLALATHGPAAAAAAS